jgi:hypothetical protein
VRRVAVAAALVALAAAGCYAPRIGDGYLACSDAGLCPDGFRCGYMNRCWLNPDAHTAEAGDLSVATEVAEAGAAPEAGASDGAGSADTGDAAGTSADARDAVAVADGGPGAPDAGKDAGVDRGVVADPGTDAGTGVDRGVMPEPPPDAGVDLRPDAGSGPDTRPDAAAPDASKKGLGAACATGSECDSNVCVDRVCCESSCPGQCEACDTSGSPGRCVQVVTGPPHGGRTPCGGTDMCVGSCDGTSRTACGFPGGVVTCSGTCPGGGLVVPGVCDGNGGCALSLSLCL